MFDGITGSDVWWDHRFRCLMGSPVQMFDGITGSDVWWDHRFRCLMGSPVQMFDGITGSDVWWDHRFRCLMGSPVQMFDGITGSDVWWDHRFRCLMGSPVQMFDGITGSNVWWDHRSRCSSFVNNHHFNKKFAKYKMSVDRLVEKLEEMQLSTVRQKDDSETDREGLQNSDQAINALWGRNMGYNGATRKVDWGKRDEDVTVDVRSDTQWQDQEPKTRWSRKTISHTGNPIWHEK